jgi:hypothetical protein
MALIHDAIAGLKAKSIEKPNIVPAPTQAQIRDAEAKLGFKFPPTFLTFLENAGSYCMSYWETFWVGDDSLGGRNIVKANISEREDATSALPAFLIAFHNDGCGDQFCFDTRRSDQDGEYPIVFWDHELSAENNLLDLFPVAHNFADWLMQEVQEHD